MFEWVRWYIFIDLFEVLPEFVMGVVSNVSPVPIRVPEDLAFAQLVSCLNFDALLPRPSGLQDPASTSSGTICYYGGWLVDENNLVFAFGMKNGDTIRPCLSGVHTIGSTLRLVLISRRLGRNCKLLQCSLHLSRPGYIYRQSFLSLSRHEPLQAPIVSYYP